MTRITRSVQLVILNTCLFGFFSKSAQSQLIIPEVNGTNTQIQINGSVMNVTGGKASGDGANLFHSFDKFGLSQGQVADFQSNAGLSNILVRVMGGQASSIDGQLRITGSSANLFLMNSAGIIFGSNASLNLPAAFMATTANGIRFGDGWFNGIGSNDYLKLLGSPKKLSFIMPEAGSIVNLGALSVQPGQQLTLIGGTILNTGQLIAPGGAVTIAAVSGEKQVSFNPEGGLLNLVTQPLTQGGVVHRWDLPIQTMPQLLRGAGVDEALGVVVNWDGTVQLTGSGITVPGDKGTAIVGGLLEARSSLADSLGGHVTVLGDRVALLGTQINASGAAGGGSIRIGGDFQGKGAIPNALGTFVSSDSRISADALDRGDGGRVIVWADQSTGFFGTVSARGGVLGGNGGFVEISGKENLTVQGQVDVGASFGLSGRVLFDPRDIQIVAGTGADDAQIIAGQILAGQGGNSSFTIGTTALAAITGNIDLQASQDINLTTSLTLPGIPGSTIRFTAGRDFKGTGQDIIATGRNVEIQASTISIGNINTSTNIDAGSISLTALGNITVQELSAFSQASSGTIGNGGNIRLSSQVGNIDTQGTQIASWSRVTGDGLSGNAGSIILESPLGSISTGSINAFSEVRGNVTNGGAIGNGGQISLSANGSISTDYLTSASKVGQDPNFNFNISQISNGTTGNAGSITLNSEIGSVNTGGANAISQVTGSGNTGVSGTYTINAPLGVVVTNGINTFSQVGINGSSSIAGNVSLTASNGNVTTKNINAISQSTGANARNGGSITLTAANGSINTELIQSQSQVCFVGGCPADDSHSPRENLFASANGGDVRLAAFGDIKTSDISSFSESFLGATGNAGSVTINSQNGTITSSHIISFSLADGGQSGEGGTLSLSSQGLITTGDLLAQSDSWASGSQSSNAGSINLTSVSENITAGKINTESTIFNSGTAKDSGSISISSGKGISVSAVDSDSEVQGDGTSGKGGSISFIAATGDINITGDITARSNVLQSGSSSTGGIISLVADGGKVSTKDILTTSEVIEIGTAGDGGGIRIAGQQVNTGSLSSSSEACSSGSCTSSNIVQSNGGGDINIISKTSIQTNDLLTFSNGQNGSGDAGNIILKAESGDIKAQLINSYSESKLGSSKDGGVVTVTASNGAIAVDSEIRSTSKGLTSAGNGQNITISATGNIAVAGQISSFSEINGGLSDFVGSSSGIRFGGDINLRSINGSINVAGLESFADAAFIPISTRSGSISISATGNINTQEIYTASQGAGGQGGAVDISTDSFFRAMGVRQTGLSSCIGSSICTTGQEGSGTVTVSHGGGKEKQPFQVGNSTVNGTKGEIRASQDVLSLEESFLGSLVRGQIQLRTQAPPITNVDNFSTAINQILIINPSRSVLRNDEARNNLPLTARLVNSPLNGKIIFNPDGSFIYFPNQGFTGAEQFIYSATDSILESANTVVTIKVAPSVSSNSISPIEKSPANGILNVDPDTVLALNQPELLINAVEESQTLNIENSLNVTCRPPKDLRTIQSELRQVERITKRRNAVMYVGFLPNKQAEILKGIGKNKQDIWKDFGKSISSPDYPSDSDQLVVALVTANGFKVIHHIDKENQNLLSGWFRDHFKDSMRTEKFDFKPRILTHNAYFNGSSTILNFPESDSIPSNGAIYVDSSGIPSGINLPYDENNLVGRVDIVGNSEGSLGLLNMIKNALSLEDPKQSLVALLPPAQKLYDQIIRPFERELSEGRVHNISFVMGTGLRSLPVAILHNGDNFLVERYSVGLIPSFSCIDPAYRNLADPRKGKLNMLAMGASKFTEVGLPDLPEVKKSIATLEKIWGADQGRFLPDSEDFTQKSLKPDFRKNTRILHLITHGAFAGPPAKSYIYLGDGNKLTMQEVEGLQLNEPSPIELLVLIACSTAQGEEPELSFAGAAVKAKVKSIIATLDSVEYEAVMMIMINFYHQLIEARNSSRLITKAEALQSAQIDMINSMMSQNPEIDQNKLPQSKNKLIPLLKAPTNSSSSEVSRLTSRKIHPKDWSLLTLVGTPW
jgi:filamentous hemagglutinin family protein